MPLCAADSCLPGSVRVRGNYQMTSGPFLVYRVAEQAEKPGGKADLNDTERHEMKV